MFIAIELPEEVRTHLVEVRRRLEPALPKIAFTRAENLHITLKFLGDVEPKKIATITDSLAMIKPARIELTASGIECFPNRGPVRIITAALQGATAPLRALVEA